MVLPTRWMVAAAALIVAGGAAIWQGDRLTEIGGATWAQVRSVSSATLEYTATAWDTVRSQAANLTARPATPPGPSESLRTPTTLATPTVEPAPERVKAPADPEPAVERTATQVAASPPTKAASYQDERRVPETTPISLPPRQTTVIIQRGGTVSSLAYQAYGRYDMLAIDLIKELNPHIDDLDWIRSGERLALPPLSAETLIRSQTDGGYRIVLASFLSPLSAEKLSEQVKRRGFVPRVSRRQVTRGLTLYRVEIADVASRHAAEQAWKVAVANCLVFIEDTPCGGAREEKP
jgi:phage tail protein X